ncbi:MAG: NotI family restriction endonuclease, partial [Cyanobacteriota bacterium]|nr:NotI family restriction endonuclease [Cyanobacteriota bacterium]
MSKIIELFGQSPKKSELDWTDIVCKQYCPYLKKRCIKARKSQPEISIGSCSVMHGKKPRPIIICPHRMLERKQIFTDCLHLL